MIYLDNAATTLPKPEPVAEAVKKSFSYMGNAGRGANEASLFTSRLLYQTRKQIADFFHMKDGTECTAAERVIFTMNATEGLNIVLKGLFERDNQVVTTNLEHNSVLRPLYELEQKGVEIKIVSCDRRGFISPEELEKSIGEKTKAIVCTHASNVTGAVNDLKAIGSICRKYGIFFIVDASQTAGIVDLDMEACGITALIFTGHKALFGPQGTGGICLADGVRVRPLLSGGSGIHSFDREHPRELPTALEAGTLNGHGIAGLHAALEWISEMGLSRIQEREMQLLRHFTERIKRIPGIRFYGWEESDETIPAGHTGTVSCNLARLDSAYISEALDERYGIATRPGAHCAPLIHQFYGTEEQGMVRFSFSWFNREQEVDMAAEALAEIAKENRGYVRAYVGAGGKTGSILKRAEELQAQGKKVLILTTTKMKIPKENFVEAPYGFHDSANAEGEVVCNPVFTAYERQVAGALEEYAFCMTGWKIPGTEKFGELPYKWMENLLYLADEILIEADGAAHMAAKAPQKGEPVLYSFMDEVQILMGRHAIGHPVREVCHRTEEVMKLLQCGMEHILTEADLWKLMREGYEVPIRRNYPDIQITKKLCSPGEENAGKQRQTDIKFR